MSSNSYVIEIISRKRPGASAQTSFLLQILEQQIEIHTCEDLIFLRNIINEAISESIPDSMQKDVPYLTARWFKQERAKLQFLERYEDIPVLNRLEKALKAQTRGDAKDCQ